MTRHTSKYSWPTRAHLTASGKRHYSAWAMIGPLASRIRVADFFSILLPGLYLVAVVSAEVLLVVRSRYPESFESHPFCGTDGFLVCLTFPAWSVLTFTVFFVSYLFGSALRAIAMSRTDELLWDVFHDGGSRTSQRSKEFPYVESIQKSNEALIHVESELRAPGEIVVPRLGEGDVNERIYGYWKAVLLQNAPGAFAYVMSFETRTRFFGGMFWATTLGLEAVALVHAGHIALGPRASEDWLVKVSVVVAFASFVAFVLYLLTPGRPRRYVFNVWRLTVLALVALLLSLHSLLTASAIGVSLVLVQLFGRNLRFARNSELCSFHQSYSAFVNKPK